MKKNIILLLYTVLFFGCMKDMNLNPDNTFYYKGDWSASVVNGRIDLKSLVLNNEMITADPDGLLRFVFRQDSVFTQNVYDYTKIPDQAPFLVKVTLDSPEFETGTNLGTFGGAKFKSIKIASGTLHWQATNPTFQPVDLRLEIKNAEIDGEPLIIDLACQPGQSQNSVSLEGLNFDLTQGVGNLTYNNLSFKFTVSSKAEVKKGEEIDLSLTLNNLTINGATGYFGQYNLELPSGKLPTDFGVLSNIAEGLYLANPSFKLITKSNIGLPVTFTPAITGISKNGRVVSLNAEPFVFEGSSTMGNTYSYAYELSPETSNLDNFLANVPRQILYNGGVLLNPEGETANDNFIDQDGYIVMGVEAELPLELKTKNLVLEQTFSDLDLGIDDDEIDYVEAFTLGFNVENGFPLDADFYTYFIDENGAVVDSAYIAMFDAATTDISGNVIAAASSVRYLEFTKGNIKNLLKSKSIKARIVLNTSGDGDQIVRILDSYYFQILIGTRFKLNYQL
ncbi:MAG: hypothetical protein Q8J88_11210 [Bacteroidales bacterium]|nr:hypothetical protein [Bacteroidales bacterium]